MQLAYDVRRLKELCSDSGTPVATGDLSADPVLSHALNRATEMVLSAARVGEEYTEEDLQELADSSTAGYDLRGLVCDLAYGLLVMRRGTGAADMDRLSPAFGAAQRTLQAISDGSRIFSRIDGGQHADAGTPRTADLTTQTTTPSTSFAAAASRRLIPSVTNPQFNWPYN
jgi:hypothetical protein